MLARSAVRTLPRCRYIALIWLALPAACAAPEPQSPFAGAWSGAERHQISFRDNTVVQQPAGAPATILGPETCAGRFRFGYVVAELGCGEGGTTYVLLDDGKLIAIHRDADVAGIEELSRS